jgi:Zn-dependent M16 (insulinase) family peptidase
MAGHAAVMNRLKAHFTTAGWADENMGGISYLFFLRDLAERVDSDWAGVLADLEAMREILVNRNAMIANVTLEADNWATFQPQLDAFIESLPQKDAATQEWGGTALPAREGFSVPAQVNFVGKAVDLYKAGYEKDGSYITILKHANLDYMWNKIRVMGGAYGGSMVFSHTAGTLSYLSWRDPNLTGTLANYDGAAAYLQKLSLSEAELEKAIIGAIGDVDQYLLPDAKGYSQMQRHLIGITDDMRQETREQLLSTTLADFKAFGEVLQSALADAKVAVVGGPGALEKANDELDDKLQITNVL